MKKYCCLFLLLFCFNVYALDLEDLKVNGKGVTCAGYECECSVSATSATITFNMGENVLSTSPESGHSIDEFTVDTTVNVDVTYKDGSSPATYRIKLIKYAPSSDNSLSSLKINDEVVTMLNGIYVYAHDVMYNTEVIKIMGTPNDKGAICSMTEYKFPLDSSSASLEYFVTAENGNVRKYIINIKRKLKPDTSLKSLTIKDVSLSFNPKTFEYNVVVPYNINKLDIDALPNHELAIVDINNFDDLVVGDNKITISVTNNGATEDYIVNVKRIDKMDESLFSLKNLIIRGTTITFDSNVLEYDLYFKEIPAKLNLEALANSDETKVTVLDNKNLKEGSIVKIQVAHNLGLTRTYVLHVKLEKNKTSNKLLIVIILSILIIVMITLFILQLKEKKHGERKSKKEENIEII